MTHDSLTTTFRVTNHGSGRMPWTAGHHFYFHVPASQRSDWVLSLPCKQWASQDFSNGSYSYTQPEWAEAALSRVEWIDRMQLSPDVEGIKLRHTPSGRQLSFEAAHADDWPVVTTWTASSDSDFFCVEPWSALPDAVHNGRGLRVLDEGGSAEIGVVVRIARAQTE